MNNCNHNKTVDKEQIFNNGTKHIRRECKFCGGFIKFIRQNKPIEEEKIYFGKYKDYKLIDIPENYLLWLNDNLENEKLLNNVKYILKNYY